MNNIHFIKEPLDTICKDGMQAASALKCTFDTFPVFDYLLQSIFLRMTGALEQKAKMIVWEMASYDAEYRYHILSTSIRECSSLKEKKQIFNNLWAQIQKLSPNEKFNPPVEKYLNDIKSSIQNIFTDSPFALAYPQDFKNWEETILEWMEKAPKIQKEMSKGICFLDKNKEWEKGIEAIINFRNTLAHNTKFHITNIPPLSTMNSDMYIYENYFIRFSLLMLIDQIFRDFLINI